LDDLKISRFSDFSIQTKNKPYRWINHAENMQRFRKIPCKLMKMWDFKHSNFYKEMYAAGELEGKRCPTKPARVIALLFIPTSFKGSH